MNKNCKPEKIVRTAIWNHLESFCVETLIRLSKLNRVQWYEVMWWNALYRLKALQLLPLLVWSGTGLVLISSSSACSSSSSSAQPPKRLEAGGTKVTVCEDCIWGPWAERKKWLQILLYNYTTIRYAKWVINELSLTFDVWVCLQLILVQKCLLMQKTNWITSKATNHNLKSNGLVE